MKQKKQTALEQHEGEVFLDVEYFRVTRFLGRGEFERNEFGRLQFAEALAFAREPMQGRPRIIYAVSRAGRSVCLEASKDSYWQELAQRVC